MNEAFSESAEFHQRPELDRNKPAKLFLYARDKQVWFRERVSEHQLPDAIDHLVEELERYTTENFDSMPELTITSSDIYYTKNIEGFGSRRVVESALLPLQGDAELTGVHAIKGTLFGFHKGEQNDIRTYVAIGDGIRQFMGGIYTPLLSVGVEGSTIQLSEYETAEQLETLDTYITEQLEGADVGTQDAARSLIDILGEPRLPAVKKLHGGAAIIARIANTRDIAPQLVDALLERVRLTLDLAEPHEIHTTLHREIINTQSVAAYKAVTGPTKFERVEDMQLGLIGESADRGIGLLILHNEMAVQVPVQHVTHIFKAER